VWSDSDRHTGDFFSYQLKICYDILDANNDGLGLIRDAAAREHKAAANQQRYERCKADAEAYYKKQFDGMYSDIPFLLGIDLASVAIGWLLVLGLIAIVRWVRRGFAAA
jgi:hypothetical protein